MKNKSVRKLDYRDMAGSLFDGGWRCDDAEDLKREYDLTDEETEKICEILEELGVMEIRTHTLSDGTVATLDVYGGYITLDDGRGNIDDYVMSIQPGDSDQLREDWIKIVLHDENPIGLWEDGCGRVVGYPIERSSKKKVSKSYSKDKSFSALVKSQRDRNAGLRKTPIMMTTFYDSIDELNSRHTSGDFTIFDAESMCPNASVVPSVGGGFEIIWFLPSGNHPGLWIHHFSFGMFITVTASYFDYPDDEGVHDFVDSMCDYCEDFVEKYVNVDKAQQRGMQIDEIKDIVHMFNDKLGDMSTPHGIPMQKSKKRRMKKHLDMSGMTTGDGYDADDLYDESRDFAYRQARDSETPIHVLRDFYVDWERDDDNANAYAENSEALDFLEDYWKYVTWNERGNVPNFHEIGGFKGFTDMFDYPEQYYEYLSDVEDDKTRGLISRLETISGKPYKKKSKKR